MRDELKFYRLSGATFYDCINTIYQFIKPFLDNKKSSFEEYGAFKASLTLRDLYTRKSNYFSIRVFSVYEEMQLQSTPVISNSKGLTETLRDIRTSTYQS